MLRCRGDVWLVRLDPTIGAEIGKTRPVVVVSADNIGVLPRSAQFNIR
ncbi:type II toxin-antitoxin system PemK/MazF family toxin [Baaleninema simplex]|nr:type II toxin-antitoxin system PemK/MazF family toxin [Baaleninema simplex]